MEMACRWVWIRLLMAPWCAFTVKAGMKPRPLSGTCHTVSWPEESPAHRCEKGMYVSVQMSPVTEACAPEDICTGGSFSDICRQ